MTQPWLPKGAIAGPIDQYELPYDWNGLIFVGEAPGAQEVIQNKAFIGPAGQLFDKLLSNANVRRDQSYVTNVFSYQPTWTCDQNGRRRNNNIMQYFSPMDYASGKTPSYRSQYLHKDHWEQLRNLNDTINAYKPRAIIAMGAIALWALTGHDKISEFRGQLLDWRRDANFKVVPTFHPAFALHKKSQESEDKITADIQFANSL